jgi:hypothetical protein
MEHDVFISHAHKDKGIADAICEKLESARLRCWIPARDISTNEDWTEATRNAIGSSRVIVLVLSENANAAHHIEREIAHAFYTRRTIIPFRVADALPRRNFLFYIGNVPWLNAVSPPAEQHLEALTARIKGLVPDRTVTSNAVPPRSARQTTATLTYPNSWIGALRASHYRTLGILKWLAIATSLFAVVSLLWVALRQTKERALRAQSNLRSTNLGSSVSPKSSPQAGGDASQPTYSFTRFGLWEAANASPTPLVQHGPQDAPLITPAERLASLTPSPRSDFTPGQRAGLTSASESLPGPLSPPEMHQTPHHHHHKAKAQEAQKSPDFATSQRDALQSQLKETEAKVQTTQKYADLVANQRDALQNQLKDAELATRQRDALETQLSELKGRAQLAEMQANLAASQWAALRAELAKAEEKAQLAQHNADFAISQRTELEAQLRKAQEEKAQAQRDANLAGFHNSAPNTQYQKVPEDVQPAIKDVDLPANRSESERTQPPNPGQNATLAPLTQTLDSSAHSDRP